jgi:hypothetical protein
MVYENLCHVVRSDDKYIHLNQKPVSLCGVALPSTSKFASSTAWIKEIQYIPSKGMSAIPYDDAAVDCVDCWAHMCANCDHWDYDHAGDKCLFMESSFAPTRP